MWRRIGGTAAVILLASTSPAVAQGGSTVDNDVACYAACGTVNMAGHLNQSPYAAPVRAQAQRVIDQSREWVNETCSNSCQKPEDPRPEE